MHKTTLKKKPRARTTTRTARAIRPLHGFKHTLNGFGDDLSHTTSRIVAKSIRKARAQSKRVGRYVTKKPYRTLGWAVAACIFLGYFASK